MSLIGNPLPSERSNGSVLEERAARPLVAGAEAENPLDRVESVGTPERVAAASPLDAAFVRTEAPMRQAGREDALTLEEVLSTDSDSLIAGQDGVLVPLAGGDPNRAPVVLVHGLNGSPRELGDIAARFLSRGRPVHVFVYESQRQPIGRSAELLASELQGLRERVGAQRIDIVAHSMGGLVARAALNRMPEPPIDTVNLRMLDSPVEGMGHSAPGWLHPIAAFFMRLFGYRAQADMMSRSEFFSSLHQPLPEGTSVRIHMSTHAKRLDVKSLPELTDAELTALRDAILTNTRLPSVSRAGLLLQALREDDRYVRLQDRLRRSPPDPQSIAAAYESEMARFQGNHTTILNDTASSNDLVDTLLRELRDEV